MRDDRNKASGKARSAQPGENRKPRRQQAPDAQRGEALPGRRDLETREDCERLVRAFYGRALSDPIIGFIFTDIARLDLEAHVPRIASFWETVLLGAHSYRGGAFRPHAELNARVRLRAGHFERWLWLWRQTVDELFCGERAELAKAHAQRVASAFELRLRALEQTSAGQSQGQTAAGQSQEQTAAGQSQEQASAARAPRLALRQITPLGPRRSAPAGPRQHQSIADGQQHVVHALIGLHARDELPDPARLLVLDGGVEHRPVAEHVVRDDRAAR